MVAAAIVRYPPDPSLRFDPGLLGAPDAAKLLAVLRSCAWLLALDLAAYAAGGWLHRWLRPGAPASGRATLERLGLGLLALAYAALALAALHGLHRPLILGGVLLLAVAGAWSAGRGWSSARPRIAAGAAAAAVLLLASPFLAAWVPDYGWDAFAYHLALPERYLFRNRIVVTPLFPHSAFPQTVEMLYLVALSLDSGALAKLLHLQFGVLTAVAVFGMARRASPRAAWLAVLVLAADPLLNWEAAVAYNDLAAAFFAVLAVAAFDEWRRDGGAPALRTCAVFAGACAAVRYPAALVPAAVILALWLRPPLPAWRGKLRASATLAGLGLLVLAPWLVRNAVFTGNPVAPAAQSLFHASGREYFHPAAIAQDVAFSRAVGFGHGPAALALLPANLTVRARLGDYSGFGFRVGVLYVAGALAFLLLGGPRASPAAATSLKVAGLIAALWFVSFQEPRYLLPALALSAAAGGVGLDLLLSRARGAAVLLWLIPVVALAHTQWSAWLLLPWRYGYAVSGLPVAGFEAQDPALAIVPALRAVLRPGDRLLPIHEPRGFFYRGLDYLPASTPELMQLVHETPTAAALADRLRGLGVTLVLVNTNNVGRYRTWFVDGYGPAEHAAALQRLEDFVSGHTTPVLADRGVFVRRLAP
jgi:hypothetical protein